MVTNPTLEIFAESLSKTWLGSVETAKHKPKTGKLKQELYLHSG